MTGMIRDSEIGRSLREENRAHGFWFLVSGFWFLVSGSLDAPREA
jgi:hypothetical protein